MSYLIGSDVVIDFLFQRHGAVDLLVELRRQGISMSVISYLEVVEGIVGSTTPLHAQRGLRTVLRHTRLIVVSRVIAAEAAIIRLELRRQKRQVTERALDILIAATAIKHRLTLVTRNTKDYADIPGVTLYEQI